MWMKFVFEMLAFRAIITWTLWLLLLLLLWVALRNWLIIYSLFSSSFNELCLCNSKSRRTYEKDRLDHESNKSTGVVGGGGAFFWLRNFKQQAWRKMWLLSMKYIPRAYLCVFAHLPFAMLMLIFGGYILIVDRLNTLKTGLLNCLNARSRGLTFRHRASCI